MKFSTTYPITAAQITAQYRLTIDGLLTFHENTIARYLTTLNIRFLHESRMGDEIVNETYSTDVPNTFVGRVVSGRGEDLCRVTSHWTRKEPVPDIAEINLVRN